MKAPRSELPFVGQYIGRKIARASNSAGWGRDIDLKTGASIWHELDDGREQGQPREYATPAGAVTAAKRWVLGWGGKYDLLVFVIEPDPYVEGHTVKRFVGYAVWDGNCAKGGTA